MGDCAASGVKLSGGAHGRGIWCYHGDLDEPVWQN